MEKPFYLLVLFGGILSVSSYPMNNEEDNREEIVTFPPNTYWSTGLPESPFPARKPFQPFYNKAWVEYNYPNLLDETDASMQAKSHDEEDDKKKESVKIKKNEETSKDKKNGKKLKTENDVMGHTKSDVKGVGIDGHVFTSLKELESDVSGFRDAMENVAEALINAGGRNSKNMGLVKSILKKDDKQQRIEDALEKTAKRRKVFEHELLNFFTNYICSGDCRKKRSSK